MKLTENNYLGAARAAHTNFLKAREDTAKAKAARGVIFKTANEEGNLSLRQISEAVGLSHSAVQQAIDAIKTAD